MHKIPFCFCVIRKLLSEKIARGLLYDGFGGKKRENLAFSKKEQQESLLEGFCCLIWFYSPWMAFLRASASALEKGQPQ